MRHARTGMMRVGVVVERGWIAPDTLSARIRFSRPCDAAFKRVIVAQCLFDYLCTIV